MLMTILLVIYLTIGVWLVSLAIPKIKLPEEVSWADYIGLFIACYLFAIFWPIGLAYVYIVDSTPR
jgi:hypothetical protein